MPMPHAAVLTNAKRGVGLASAVHNASKTQVQNSPIWNSQNPLKTAGATILAKTPPSAPPPATVR
jgi:hypothetical protein